MYIPQADRSLESKEEIYNQPKEITTRKRNKEIVYTLGDFHARVQRKVAETETCICPHTSNQHNTHIETMTEHTETNRAMFVEHCVECEDAAMNTMFQHSDEKLLTYKSPSVESDPPWT